MLIWINATYFCCGVVTDKYGIIREAAPIVKWSIGKNEVALKNNLLKRNVLIEWKEL